MPPPPPPAVRSTPPCASCRARSARPCTISTLSAARSTTSPTTAATAASGSRSLAQWRRDIDALYAGEPPARLAEPGAGGADLRARARGFPRRHRRHGNGRARRYPRARPCDARSLLRPRRQRGRPAERARVRHERRRRHRARVSSRPRACSSPIRCATSTRTPPSAASICRANFSKRPASPATTRRPWRPTRRSASACAKVAALAAGHFEQGRRHHGAQRRAPWCARRASWARPTAASCADCSRAAGRRRARRSSSAKASIAQILIRSFVS